MKKIIFLVILVAIGASMNLSADSLKGLKEICHSGDADACRKLMKIYLLDKNRSKMEKYYILACDNGDGGDCYNVALAYAGGGFFEKENNSVKAENFFLKACNKGEVQLCTVAGIHYYTGDMVKQNYLTAEKFFVKSCDRGDTTGCYNLGIMYGKGEGVQLNYTKAKQFFHKACKRGFQEGCIGYKKLKKY